MASEDYMPYMKGPSYYSPFSSSKKRSSSNGRNFRLKTTTKLQFDTNAIVNRAKLRIDSSEIQIGGLQTLEPLSHIIDDQKILDYISELLFTKMS